MKPRKPTNKKHVLSRCDGSEVTWREKWAWRMDHCEECGKPYAGTGKWHEVSSVPGFHVGEFVLPGRWACCGKEFGGRMPGVNAVIRDLKDPQEYVDA